MKHIFFLVFISLVTSACGGGGGHGGGSKSSSVSSTSSVPVAASSSSQQSSIISSSSSSVTSSSVAQSSAASSIPFAFISTSFVSGEQIPIKHTCYGTEVSPQLQWDITSPDIKSFTLIMEDYDAIALVGYPYVHWNVYNIPADTRVVAEGATNLSMPLGSVEGVNHDGLSRYSGPCPPEGTGTHHYFFALYALNVESLSIDKTKPMRRSIFEKQYSSSIIQKAEISTSYFYK